MQQKIEWIAEAWGTYKEEFMARLDHHRRMFNALPPLSLDVDSSEMRIKLLTDLYNLAVDFQNAQWWDHIKHRVHMVLFHEKFEQEVRRRGYWPSVLALTF